MEDSEREKRLENVREKEGKSEEKSSSLVNGPKHCEGEENG